jgi:K+-transporting ATPase ATPase C chain
MRQEMMVALRMTVVTLVLTGLAYPLAVTGLAQILFPARANGSVIATAERIVGSELIGQRFQVPPTFTLARRPRAAAMTERTPPARTWDRRPPSSANA